MDKRWISVRESVRVAPGRHLSELRLRATQSPRRHASRLRSEWRFPGHEASVRDRRQARNNGCTAQRDVWGQSPESIRYQSPDSEYVRQWRVLEHGCADNRIGR